MMPFIYTQGDSSMKLKGVGLKCPEKNILNQKISFLWARLIQRGTDLKTTN